MIKDALEGVANDKYNIWGSPIPTLMSNVLAITSSVEKVKPHHSTLCHCRWGTMNMALNESLAT